MEPLTHFLTGACIGRAGFNRKTAYATLAAVLAAEAADLDILWGFAGPVEELKHHRGITHTLIGAPVVAGGVVVGAVGLSIDGRERRRSLTVSRALMNEDPGQWLPVPKCEGHGAPPLLKKRAKEIHWGWLYLTALIAALSHILLDWTNDYGVRPFFPFNSRWYEASIIFIAEPVIWALLLLALIIVPWILGFDGPRDWRPQAAVSWPGMGDIRSHWHGRSLVLEGF